MLGQEQLITRKFITHADGTVIEVTTYGDGRTEQRVVEKGVPKSRDTFVAVAVLAIGAAIVLKILK